MQIPERARIVDFVISDSNKEIWDNNHGQDFHTSATILCDRAALEQQTYEDWLSASKADDEDTARRVGAYPICPLDVTLDDVPGLSL